MFGLGIRLVGDTAAKLLLKEFKSIDAIMNASLEQLIDIEGIGEGIAKSIFDFFKLESSVNLINELKASGVNMNLKENDVLSEKLASLTFVITGTLPTMSRNEAKELIELNGGKVVSSVSKKTDYLLVGENAGSKLDKANQLNIKVISQDDLLDIINK